MLNRKCITEIIFILAIQVVILILIAPYNNSRNDLAITGFLLGLLSGGIGTVLREIQKITRSKSLFFELSLLFLLFVCLFILASISLSLSGGYFAGMIISVSTSSMISTLHSGKCKKGNQ